MTAITISTIGDLIDHAMPMNAWCHHCARGVEIDLQKLAEIYGREESYIVSETRMKLVCKECGGPLSITIAGR